MILSGSPLALDPSGARWPLLEVLGLMSHALDLGEGQPVGHAARSAWIGVQIGQMAGLPDADLAPLALTILLKDLGGSAASALIATRFCTDDLDFKRGFKTLRRGRLATLRLMMGQAGRDLDLTARAGTLREVLRGRAHLPRDMIRARSEAGRLLARALGLPQAVQDGIAALDEHWDGRGWSEGRRDAALPRAANIALLAQVADVFRVTRGPQAALAEVRARAGTWFDPLLVGHFLDLAAEPHFWDHLAAPDIEERLFALIPPEAAPMADAARIDQIVRVFAQVIDAKSPFSRDHSHRVALYADMIAVEFGLTDKNRRRLRQACLLHDLGILAVSSHLMDTPGRLTEPEWRTVRTHPWHGQRILERIPVFAEIAPIVGAHHERLDGTGYPAGLKAPEIGVDARILTVADVFDALSAARAWRPAQSSAVAFATLEGDVGGAFDVECVAALRAALAQVRYAA